MELEMNLTDVGYETPQQVAKFLHSLAHIYTVASEELVDFQNSLDVIETVIARREWQLTPAEGWEGKNAEQRKVNQSSVLWEDARYQRAKMHMLELAAAIRLAEANAKSASRSISAYQSIASLVIANDNSE